MRHTLKLAAIVLALVLMAALAGCGAQPEPTTVPTTVPTTAPILSFTLPEGASIDVLQEYPHLESVDLTASDDLAGIWAWIQAHPEVEVTYLVTIGTETVPGDTTELTLTAAEPQELAEKLQYLPSLTALTLENTDWSAEELADLGKQYPDLTLSYSLMLGGTLVDHTTEEIDGSWITADRIEEVAAKLAILPNLKTVKLMDENGTSPLTMADVKALQDAAPGILFDYSFEFFGQTLSTTQERVEYDRVEIGNENEEQIRLALDILTNCIYFKLDDCGVSTPVMASLREDYPGVKIVWRIHIDHFNMLTDETVLRLTHRLRDYNVHDLKYMTDTVYLDIGHTKELTDLSFIEYMPNLECVILDAEIYNLDVFANCKKLVWLEVCYTYLNDISALKDHPTLKYLNISFSKVTDLSPLENVKLDRLNALGIPASNEQKQAFVDSHPDCTYAVFVGGQPYGYGWRYNDHGYTYCDYYRHMREVFRYDDLKYWGNHREN